MRDPKTGRFVKATHVPEEKPQVSLEDKAKARYDRIRAKVKSGGRVMREMPARPERADKPRRSILNEITQRNRRPQG